MPPKKSAAASASASASVYIVREEDDGPILSVHASQQSADAAKKETDYVEVKTLIGGTITVDTVVEEKKAKPAKAKAVKSEDAPKANTAAKKTKTPAEQRAANVDKPKKGQVSEKDLPGNIQKLLKGNGGALAGMAIIVTGIPPVMGRANAEKLVVLYGGKVSKSLSKNTSLVVVGNEAGPTK